MDIKAKISELVDKIKSNPDLLTKFKSDPTGVIKSLIGIELPTDQLKSIVDGVKAKIDLDNVSDKVSGIAGKLGGLFGKK